MVLRKYSVHSIIRCISGGEGGVLGQLRKTDRQNKDRPVDTAQKTVVYSENYMKLRNAPCWRLLKAYWLRDATADLTFNNCMFCPHCVYLRTNSNLCPVQHKFIGFYKRDERFYSEVRTGSSN